MRIKCSPLNYDLCYNVHVTEDPSCVCGAQFETEYHFFFECLHYNAICRTMIDQIEEILPCSLNIILYRSNKIADQLTHTIFDAVHKFIYDSKRFK